MIYVVALLVGYGLGSIPFAYILGMKKAGVDLRKLGSGNLGATNVLRNLGFLSFVFCALLDIAKGFLPVFLFSRYVGAPVGALAGLAAVLGHCYSPFMGYKGGKGVAVSAGLLLAFDWRVLILSAVIMGIVLLASHIMSLASMSAAVSMPIIYLILNGFDIYFLGAILLAGFVIFKHRENISRLRKGEESKLF